MAGYVPLTQEGKIFISNACNNIASNYSKHNYTIFQGKSSDKNNDKSSLLYNIDGHLPYCDPPISGDKIWVAKPLNDNGIVITTTQEYAESLIKWYNLYGNQYNLDANVIAAQTFQESQYILWNYTIAGDAIGISQFTMATFYGIVINSSEFTPEEKKAIVIGGNNPYASDAWDKSSSLGKKNRAIFFQNIMNNPKIMLKAQFSYMNYIAKKCNGLASSALFGYSRGPAIVKPSYVDSVNAIKGNPKFKLGYEDEGIKYVYSIFNYLGNPTFTGNRKLGYFGYDKEPHDLKLNEPFNEFNSTTS